MCKELSFASFEYQKRHSMVKGNIDMERQRLAVTKRVGKWGSVYIIGGTEADGELLPAEQADDIIARFDHEQALLGGGVYHTPAISTQFCGDSL
jgi:hypothetical protein